MRRTLSRINISGSNSQEKRLSSRSQLHLLTSLGLPRPGTSPHVADPSIIEWRYLQLPFTPMEISTLPSDRTFKSTQPQRPRRFKAKGHRAALGNNKTLPTINSPFRARVAGRSNGMPDGVTAGRSPCLNGPNFQRCFCAAERKWRLN